MVKSSALSEFITDYKDLERYINFTLKRHDDCIKKIVEDLKEKLFSNIESIEGKIFLTKIISDMVKSYFSDLLQEDYMEFEVYFVDEEKKH